MWYNSFESCHPEAVLSITKHLTVCGDIVEMTIPKIGKINIDTPKNLKNFKAIKLFNFSIVKNF